MAVKEDRKKHDISSIIHRTLDSYDKHIKLLKVDPSVAPLYGIKYECSFNKLQYFHCIDGLPSDVHPDLLDGICIDVLESLLIKSVESGFITKEYLINEIVNFKYMATD